MLGQKVAGRQLSKVSASFMNLTSFRQQCMRAGI